MNKTVLRFFTIADFTEEEDWLREQHRAGWRLVRAGAPLYTFESCTPEDVIYRLDYRNKPVPTDYRQMAADFGWEYLGNALGWAYFRKPAAAAESPEDAELFSDNASRAEQIAAIMTTRLVPILIILVCCLIPAFLRALSHYDPGVWNIVLLCLLGLCFGFVVVLAVYCSVKLKRLENRYKD